MCIFKLRGLEAAWLHCILQEMVNGMVPNHVFTDEKKFDIQQVVNQQNDRVRASPSSTEEKIVTRRQNPQSVIVWASVTKTGRSSLIFVPPGVKLNSQRYNADILEGCLLPWTKNTFKELPDPCNRTLRPLTPPSSPSPGFKGKSPQKYARKSGMQRALTLTLWTSLSGQSWRPRPAPLSTQLWMLFRQNWWRSRTPSLRKLFVPPMPHSQPDWGP